MAFLIPTAIGLVAGLIGGMLGVGGSLIIIPALVLYLSQTGQYTGVEQHLLQAAAMIVNVFVAAPSVVAHYRAGAIMKRVVLVLVPSAQAAILLGVWTSNSPLFARQRGAYLAMLLAGFLAYVAVYNTWRMFASSQRADRTENCRPSIMEIVLVGLLMGFPAGLLGIGGGAIAVPMQQLILRLPLRRAIANSATAMVFVAAVGSAYKNFTLTEHGFPIAQSLGLAAVLIPTAMLGGYLGGRLTHVLPLKTLHLVFALFMAAIACATFARAWEVVHPADSPSTTRHTPLPIPRSPVVSLESLPCPKNA